MKRLLTAALLAISSTVFAATLNPVQLLNPAGSTAGQAILSTGPSTAPGWANLTATSLAAQAANTVVANVTASSASPTAFAMPSCSTANSALLWTSGSGFTCGASRALTTGNLSQFAATTSAQLLGVISDETGSGSLVFGTSPTIATPNITGITNASNAAAGNVGEYITATGTNVALTTVTQTNVASISLSAGDWDVTGSFSFNPAGTTVVNAMDAGINTVSATLPAAPFLFFYNQPMTAGSSTAGAVPSQRVSVSTTTTVYLVVYSAFTTSTCTVTGIISARRRR